MKQKAVRVQRSDVRQSERFASVDGVAVFSGKMPTSDKPKLPFNSSLFKALALQAMKSRGKRSEAQANEAPESD